jgi:MATE family multidrug resistance protein
MKRYTLSSDFRLEARAFLQLAIPLASAQVAQALTGFVDTVMMGRLGQEALAAGGLAVMVFMTLLMIGVGVLSSVGALAAEACGAGNPLQVGQIARQGGWLVLALLIPGLTMTLSLETILRWCRQEPEVIALATSYIQVMQWGLLPGWGFAVLRGLVTATGHTQSILVIMVVANLLNVMGNVVFAFGQLGFPAMGLSGLALASVLAQGVMFIGLLGYISWHRNGRFRPYQLFCQLHRLQPSLLLRLLNVGLPIGAVTIMENGLFTVMTFMVGAIGTHVLAAQQLALQTIIITFMVPLGMSYAATARVGLWYGQRDWAGVKRAATVSVSLTIAVMFFSGVIFVLFPAPLIGLYLDINDPANQAVVQIGTAMLFVAGFGQVVDGVQRTANGILQGLQDTRYPMLLSLFAYWGVGLISGYGLGFLTPWGGVGIWVGVYLGLGTAAITYLWRFRTVLRTLTTTTPVASSQPLY